MCIRDSLTPVRARGKSDSKTDRQQDRQTHRRIVPNHFSRRFGGCTSLIRSYLEVDFSHDANTSIDMEVKCIWSINIFEKYLKYSFQNYTWSDAVCTVHMTELSINRSKLTVIWWWRPIPNDIFFLLNRLISPCSFAKNCYWKKVGQKSPIAD